MYFEENQVNEILSCNHCHGRLEEPKLLPCGVTICSYCASTIKIHQVKMFDCLICSEKHEMPRTGLPDNKALSKMLLVNPKKVSRGMQVDLLENSLVEILKIKRLIKLIIEDSNYKIKEHFIGLRSDVQLKTEKIIEQINDINSKLIEEIDDHEKKLIHLSKNNSFNEFNNIVLELEEFYVLNNEYLNQHNIDEKLVSKADEQAACLINKSELEIKKLNDIVFDDKIFVFEKSCEKLNTSILGVVSVKSTKFNSNILLKINQKEDLITLCDISNIKKYNLIYRASQDGFESSSFHFKCDKKPNTLIIIKSENGNIFGGYTEQDWTATEEHDFKIDKEYYVFSLINKHDRPVKLKFSDITKGIWCRNGYGPVLGYGPVIRISDKSNQNTDSMSNLGVITAIFKRPSYADNLLEAQSFLAGSQYFKVSEIEAYTLE
jgi:hypothetical protein